MGAVRDTLGAESAEYARWTALLEKRASGEVTVDAFTTEAVDLFQQHLSLNFALNAFLPTNKRISVGVAGSPRSLPATVARAPEPEPEPAPSGVQATTNLFAGLTDPSWRLVLQPHFASPLSQKIVEQLAAETQPVYPPNDLIFAALNHTPLERVKVVIIGQDPYYNPGQAHGLAFSCQGAEMPDSLNNIFTELETDLSGWVRPSHGNLESWAQGGVCLLNAALTVRRGAANSHAAIWEAFTNGVISAISERCDGVVFMLWGRFAQDKIDLIDTDKNR